MLTLNLAQARDFTVASWGGALQEAQRQVYFAPFSKLTNIHVQEDVYDGGWGKFKAMIDTKQYVWDVVNVESGEMQRGCEEGAFLKIDWSKIPGGKSAFIPAAAADCGIGAYTWAFVVAYDSDAMKGKEAPKSLADFFDMKKWPGKRGMRKGPRFNLELALLADGVPAASVYRILNTKEGVDRAFRKLDEIKSSIVWWGAPAQAPDLLASGSVVMTIAPNGRIAAANKAGKHFKMIFKPGLMGVDFWIALKDSPNIAAAKKFLEFVSDGKRQAELAKLIPYAPTNKSGETYLNSQEKETLPVGANIANALDTGSTEANQFWVDKGDELIERWNAWLR